MVKMCVPGNERHFFNTTLKLKWTQPWACTIWGKGARGDSSEAIKKIYIFYHNFVQNVITARCWGWIERGVKKKYIYIIINNEIQCNIKVCTIMPAAQVVDRVINEWSVNPPDRKPEKCPWARHWLQARLCLHWCVNESKIKRFVKVKRCYVNAVHLPSNAFTLNSYFPFFLF